jgi:hypothetical protein
MAARYRPWWSRHGHQPPRKRARTGYEEVVVFRSQHHVQGSAQRPGSCSTVTAGHGGVERGKPSLNAAGRCRPATANAPQTTPRTSSGRCRAGGYSTCGNHVGPKQVARIVGAVKQEVKRDLVPGHQAGGSVSQVKRPMPSKHTRAETGIDDVSFN